MTAIGVSAMLLSVVLPADALTISKTADPAVVPGRSGVVTYTITASDCEDAVVGCFVTFFSDDPHGPLTECMPALIKKGQTYTCTYRRTVRSDIPATVSNQATVTGYVGPDFTPFSASAGADVEIEADPDASPAPGDSGSVIEGDRVRLPRIDADRLAPRVRIEVRTGDIEGDVDRSLRRSVPDADRISRDVERKVR